MVGTVNIGKNIKSFDSAEQFGEYSRVTITVDDAASYTAGNDTGRTLNITCPWGTQAMAQNILTSLSGYQYQPMTVEGALVTPTIELGDGITANNIYSGVYNTETKYDALCSMTIGAPVDEEIDHEFPFVSDTQRSTSRRFAVTDGLITVVQDDLSAAVTTFESELAIQASQIAAKVSAEGGNNNSFGWTLTSDGFILYSNNSAVMTADADGITVKGKIQADSGYIGGSGGFTILNGKLYSGNHSTFDSTESGVYIGTNGISLGSNFRVTPSGSVTATNITVNSGTFNSITLDGASVSNSNISGGSFSGGSVTGSTISGGSSFYGYGSLTEGSRYNGEVISTYIQNLVANTINTSYINTMFGDVRFTLRYQGYRIIRSQIVDGNGQAQNVLKWMS